MILNVISYTFISFRVCQFYILKTRVCQLCNKLFNNKKKKMKSSISITFLLFTTNHKLNKSISNYGK